MMVVVAGCIKVSAGIYHARHAKDDEQDYRYHKVGYGTLAGCCLFALLGSHTMFYDVQFGAAHFVELSSIGSFIPFLQSGIVFAHRLEIKV